MIDELKYLSKLGDAYIFVENTVAYRLTPDAELRMTERMTSGIKEMASDPKFWVGTRSKEFIDRISSKIEEETYKKNYAKVKNYKKWVLNYGLVMLCYIFDEFMLHTLEEILSANPKLTEWLSKKEILGRFQEKILKGNYRPLLTGYILQKTNYSISVDLLMKYKINTGILILKSL